MANEYGNYATLNPLTPDVGAAVPVYSEGNRKVVNGNAANLSIPLTLSVPTSDTQIYYVEFKLNTVGNDANYAGVAKPDWAGFGTDAQMGTSVTGALGINNNASNIVIRFNTSNQGGSTAPAANDCYCVAIKGLKAWVGLYDASASNTKWISQDGTERTSDEPAAGTNASYTFTDTQHLLVGCSVRANGGDGNLTLLADSNDWLGTPPSGAVAISTANLPTPAIINPDDHYYSKVVDHDGSSTAFTLPWNADTYDTLFIVKNATGATEDWYWTNGLRGYNKYQTCPTLVTETTSTTILTISGTSVTLGSTLGDKDYLVECHKAGLASGRASDDTGAITVTRSTNTTSQFSIIQRTGTGGNTNYGHGLDAVDWRVSLNLSSAHSFSCQHTSLTDGTMILYMDSTGAQNAHVTGWNSTFPSSTLCYLGTGNGTNQSSSTYNEYLWGSVDGYSAFGVYETNESADGPFLNTGFCPSSVFIKHIDEAGSWYQLYEAQNDGNPQDLYYSWNLDTAQPSAFTFFDWVSNGVKFRTDGGSVNGDGGTVIYGAWGGRSLTDGGVNQGRAK